MTTLASSPIQDGFRMPAEYEAHQGCWMLWPERSDVWRCNARPAQLVAVMLANTIAKFETVTLGVSRRCYETARSMLSRHIRVVEIPSDDCWIRDIGPTFVLNSHGTVRGVGWDFNAWGARLYPHWQRDQGVSSRIVEIERMDCYRPDIVLEGGAIDVDGQGTVMVTEECILDLNRNPSLKKADAEKTLARFLNVTKIIWLSRGLYADETTGHIDNLCRFVAPGVVVLTWTDDESDPQHEISAEAHERLRCEFDARGRALQIHLVHQPTPLYRSRHESEGVRKVKGAPPSPSG